ncbi:MAG: HD domain-containing phosphohydrolase [bacterium]
MHHIHRVLVVDDESYICDVIAEMLTRDPEFAVASESDPIRALELLSTQVYDLVLTDLVMGEHSGMEIMEAALARNRETIVIMMTGHPTVENAIAAVKRGAYDYLVKPFKLDLLRTTIDRGLRRQELARENVQLREMLALYQLTEVMGASTELELTLGQLLNLTMKEFSAVAASILVYDERRPQQFTVKALQERVRGESELEFLRGATPHSLRAISQKDIEAEDLEESGGDPTQQLPGSQFRSLISCPLAASGKVVGVLNLVRSEAHREFSTGEMQSLKIIASKAAYLLGNAELIDDLQDSYLSTISAFAAAVEARDHYTRGHTERVTYLCELIARELGWDEKRLMNVSMGALLHDVGKIGVPDRVLNKKGSLEPEERELMQTHPELGARMIEGIEFLKPCLPFILSHHERWDGGGYPQGLKGEEIPIEGRILTVADTFDAILTNRPYRDAGTIQLAISELRKFSGIQFDPQIVATFLKLLEHDGERIETLYSAMLEQTSVKTALA